MTDKVKFAVLAMDRDGDGSLTEAEACAVVRSLGRQLNSADETKYLDKFKAKGKAGLYAAEDVEKAAAEMMGAGDIKKELLQAFKQFDRTNTKTISASELDEILRNLGELLNEEERTAICSLGEKDGRIHYEKMIDSLLRSD